MKITFKKIIFIFVGLIILALLFELEKYNVPPVVEQDDENVVCDVIKEETIYLTINEVFDLGEEGFISEDNDVAKVIQNRVFGFSKGETKVYKDCTSYNVIVSNLYTKPILSNDKPALPCGKFSKEDNELLDNVLKYKINEVGYKSRAAAVEAARFLLLCFPYHMNYFNENGRLATESINARCDAEGRYYHEGLYLNEYKFSEIEKSISGPATWGCPIYSYPAERNLNNSLDCSGFVTWCLLNAGYDPGDIGAGPGKIYNLQNLGKRVTITKDSIENIKVGDLLGMAGHIGILIGIDEENYYVAESNYDIDVTVSVVKKEEFVNFKFERYIDMDEYYGEDGKLTNMW